MKKHEKMDRMDRGMSRRKLGGGEGVPWRETMLNKNAFEPDLTTNEGEGEGFSAAKSLPSLSPCLQTINRTYAYDSSRQRDIPIDFTCTCRHVWCFGVRRPFRIG
ncbi:unnamed protein product, partial [Ectocarpus sp. 6 AP-2014]